MWIIWRRDKKGGNTRRECERMEYRRNREYGRKYGWNGYVLGDTKKDEGVGYTKEKHEG